MLRRKLVALVVALGLLGVGLPVALVVASVPASATESPTWPDSGGYYAYCNDHLTPYDTGAGGGAYQWQWSLACESVANPATVSGWYWGLNFTSGYAPRLPVYNAPPGTWPFPTSPLPAGQYGYSSSTATSFFTAFGAVTAADVASATLVMCEGFHSWDTCHPVREDHRDTDTGSSNAIQSMPTFPGDTFPGGVPGVLPTTPIDLPAYTCQRDLIQAADGSWVVNLNAAGPTGLPAGAVSGAVINEQWVLPWDPAHPVPKVSTVTVPASGKPAGGWSLEFDATVTVTNSYTFPAPDPDLPKALRLVGTNQPWILHAGEHPTGSPDADVYEAVDPAGGHYLGWYRGDGTLDVFVTTTGDPAPRHINVGPVDRNVTSPGEIGYVHGFLPAGWEHQGQLFYFDRPPAGDYVALAPDNHQTITMQCFVTLDVARPAVGGSATSAPPATTPSGAGQSGGGCDAGSLGHIPLIGGVLDATAGLACSIGGLLGKLGDLLRWLLIPQTLPWSDMWDGPSGLHSRFPFTAITQAGSLVGALTGTMTESNYGPACGPVLDMSGPLSRVSLGADTSAIKVGLPNPSGSGCAGSGPAGARTEWDDTLGDVWGYRSLMKAIGTLFLVVIFVQRVAGSFIGGGTGIEAGDEGGSDE